MKGACKSTFAAWTVRSKQKNKPKIPRPALLRKCQRNISLGNDLGSTIVVSQTTSDELHAKDEIFVAETEPRGNIPWKRLRRNVGSLAFGPVSSIAIPFISITAPFHM